ncbi:diacylglycerol kinase family protein [Collinsella sp. zg1085]|uniref:diacylglycerol kinase family protein n=1 Tax=Collinsella sp. zg1085 TaxID=2844380 RepID=UPI001C0CE6EF|nr:diacylglycerol kinase family protein [Collinsella sp. zg1085]QWT16983.1 diacylglycerol kinase family protein [Collinsella sp. zg1085]
MIPGSQKDHPSFVRSFAFALEGFMTAVKTERNIKIMLVIGAAALSLGIVLQLDVISWIIILFCCGLVLHAELANTALEAVVDLACQDIHPLAKRAKDIAAASVYVLSCVAAIVGCLVYAHALGWV